MFLKGASNRRMPRFSPDGHYFVYVAVDSDRQEVYVRDSHLTVSDAQEPAAELRLRAAAGTGPGHPMNVNLLQLQEAGRVADRVVRAWLGETPD